MPVINNPILEKYKTYYTERVKGKDGITRPITKVHYQKICSECSGFMSIEKYKAGSKFKPFFCKWKCADPRCKHSEAEPTQQEFVFLKMEDEAVNLGAVYGMCIHGENLTVCEICNH